MIFPPGAAKGIQDKARFSINLWCQKVENWILNNLICWLVLCSTLVVVVMVDVEPSKLLGKGEWKHKITWGSITRRCQKSRIARISSARIGGSISCSSCRETWNKHFLRSWDSIGDALKKVDIRHLILIYQVNKSWSQDKFIVCWPTSQISSNEKMFLFCN